MATPTDEPDPNAFAAKFLLNTASQKARTKSWLQASLPDEPEAEAETTQNVEIVSDDELAGVGAPKKSQVDVLTNRHLANANDNLRKSLMGKKAYSKFQHGQKNGFEASKPMPKQARQAVDDDSDDEESKGKGRSTKAVQKQKPDEGADRNEFRASSKSKKRPLSFADEIIAKRNDKKKAKLKG